MFGVTALLAVLVAAFVNLKPHVDEYFFFSSNDPQFRESHKIDEMFPSGDQLILAVASDDIASERYLEQLAHLTQAIASVRQVIGVRSLADGPKNFADAEKSPLWKRLLISENGKSSNVVVFVQTNSGERLMRQIEQIARKFDAKNFNIRIAGTPYVADMIRHNLQHDFLYFSLTAVLLFGVAMGVVFRSVRLVSGMLATCISAALLTLFVQSLFGEKVGILTANLVVIVFVIALSHSVYMTFNWQTLAQRGSGNSDDLGAKARRMTFPASFWSMVCSLLGFGSLLIVQGKAAAGTRRRRRPRYGAVTDLRVSHVSGLS